jgi:FkbM family methyltransferase
MVKWRPFRAKEEASSLAMTEQEIPFKSDLIYDVGMHDGKDTENYLADGYRVLAIDADPDLASKARERFHREIASGKLTILNVGISTEASVEKFWICETKSVWNSFDRSLASRNGCPHHSIDVPTRPFVDILRQFGIPTYLKIDIEGRDVLCLEALKGMPLPKFVSAEDGGPDPKNGIPRALTTMHDAGYRYFNLVAQQDFRPLFRGYRGGYKANVEQRAVNSLAYGRLRVPLLYKLAEPMSHRGELARRNGGRQFRLESSGPWGKGIPGGWVSFEEASRMQAQIRAAYYADRKADPDWYWWDWHATTEKPN